MSGPKWKLTAAFLASHALRKSGVPLFHMNIFMGEYSAFSTFILELLAFTSFSCST